MIQDLAGNLFITASSPMIGFIPESATVARELQLRIYNFLIEGIREEDQTNGAKFVERFLGGPQGVWNGIDATTRSLPDMWSVTKCADRFLPYLKWIVGWTSKLDYITDDMDSATLRRLIATSVPFWKIRGTEDALAEILQLTTAKRVRIWNWFDLRYISDETALGEENTGYDPWMIDLPGSPNFAERQMNVRIVDDGTLNRRLVRNLVRLTRPSGERITISYLGFLDLFTTDDDTSQWAERIGTVTPVVSNGEMMVSHANAVYANPAAASSWQNYTVSARLRGETLVMEVYRTGDGDNYLVYIAPESSTIVLYSFVAGSPIVLAEVATYLSVVDFPSTGVGAGGWFLRSDLFYMVRVSLVPEAGATRITVFLDGNLVISVLDAGHTKGTVGFPGLFSSTTMEVSEVEMFFNPLETDFIDIVTAGQGDLPS
jgi:phage tail-like protein